MRRASLVAGAIILLVLRDQAAVRARRDPLDFCGWARLDKGALIRWDLAFYEPWFLGRGVLVTLGALHHYDRTGGSRRGARRLASVSAAQRSP